MGTGSSKRHLQKETATLLPFEKKIDRCNIEENEIDFVCYNVYFKGFNRQATIDAICKIKADILILQETNKNWQRVVTNNTRIASKWRYIKCVNDRYGEGGTILLTNYEIKSLDVIKRFHKWWYSAHRFTLDIVDNSQNENTNDDMHNNEATLLQIYSIHLIAPFPPNNLHQCICCLLPCTCYHCCDCTFECCGDSRNEIRAKEIRHCLNGEYYNNKMKTVIIGDFNCMDGDCHTLLQNEFGLKSIWNNKKKHNYLFCCRHEPYSWRGCCHFMCCCAPKLFDHIYYSPNDFVLIHSDMIQIGESDHYPIWCRLATKF